MYTAGSTKWGKCMSIKKLLATFTGSLAVTLAMPLVVMAAPAYTLFGDATEILDGSNTVIETVSDNANPTDKFGGIDFDVPAGTTFADLNTLSTDFNVTNDDCGGGSPRFQVTVNQGGTEKNIMIYLGTAPNYTDCTMNTWIFSGDLLEAGLTIDTSQLTGGTFYDQYTDALTEFETLSVLGVQLVTDGFWSAAAANDGDSEQTVLFDDVDIDGVLYDFEPVIVPPVVMPTSKDDCKKGGWMDFANAFKNQGDCVSWVATNGRNPATGLVQF